MTRPDEQPTTVLPQQTVEQPSVTTSPATRRARTWHRRIPARIGRARSSTVVIGALFVVLGGLNLVLPTDPYVTVPTDYGDVRVRSSQLTRTPTPTPTSQVPTGPATDDAPDTTAPAPPTTSAPRTTPTPTPTATTTPSETATPTPTPEETSAPSTSSQPTSGSRSGSTSAPATTVAPSTPTGTADPTD